MTVNLSALAGAGQQFFDNNGIPLSGGKLYSYAAGTSTPQATYTTSAGNIAHANPIVLDSAGRVATGEIWLTAGNNYKFALYTSTNTLLATWDNITGINGTGIATNAANVQYDPAGTGAVSTTVQAKLRQYVSVKDFGAVGNGSTNDTTAIQNAINYLSAGGSLYFPAGIYLIYSTDANYLSLKIASSNITLFGDGSASVIKASDNQSILAMLALQGGNNVTVKNLCFDGNRQNNGTKLAPGGRCVYVYSSNVKINNVEFKNSNFSGTWLGGDSTLGDTGSIENIEILSCNYHDNGGWTSTGTCSAIFGPNASTTVKKVSILNSIFENNYPPSGPNDSAAINLSCQDVIVNGNFLKNNYNVNGGQMAITSVTSAGVMDGVGSGRAIITNNNIIQTGTLNGDITGGIEIFSSKCIISNNIITGATSSAIYVEGTLATSSRYVLISNNTVDISNSTGLTAIQAIQLSGNNLAIRNNHIISANYGFNFQAANDIVLESNYIGPDVTTAFSGTVGTYCSVVRNNAGGWYQEVSFTPGVLANNAINYAFAAFDGLRFGDSITATFSLDLQQVSLEAYVSANDTAIFIFRNSTGGSVTLGAGTVRVWAEKRHR